MSFITNLILNWLAGYLQKMLASFLKDWAQKNADEKKNNDVKNDIINANTDDERRKALDEAARNSL